jgi:hypothetical protein
MMKKILYSGLLGIVLCINMSCNSKKQDTEIEENYPYTLKDYVTKKFKVYEIKQDIITILDSIIESTNNCERFKNTQIMYAVSIEYYFDDIRITIPEYKHYDLLLYDADALFFYKGYQFIYFGRLLNKCFNETETIVERHCIKPVDIPLNEICIDDSIKPLSCWHYCYKNDKLIIVSTYHCGKSWLDKDKY